MWWFDATGLVLTFSVGIAALAGCKGWQIRAREGRLPTRTVQIILNRVTQRIHGKEHISLFCFAWTPRRDYDEKMLVETRKQHLGVITKQNLSHSLIFLDAFCRLSVVFCQLYTVTHCNSPFFNLPLDQEISGIGNATVTCSIQIMPHQGHKRTAMGQCNVYHKVNRAGHVAVTALHNSKLLVSF